jgi:CTP:molybdopterin cytidylyltransferase MocA
MSAKSEAGGGGMAAVILAAGAGSRWRGEGPKALALWEGETFVKRAERAALGAGCGLVVRVLGAHAETVRAQGAEEGVEDVFYAGWAGGMGGSLACGVAAVLARRPDADAVCVLLADQPLVEARHVRALAEGLAAAGRSIAVCDYGDGTQGPPAIFLRRHFEALLTLTGDEGARRVAREAGAEVFRLRVVEARHDVDQLEDYARLTRVSEF